ncbi:MAG: hypothetical protein GX146_05050 [Myxococcales bacterium]|jgi:hypothetical protein|nr:hypothetical protein [Myxococcales bacterium]
MSTLSLFLMLVGFCGFWLAAPWGLVALGFSLVGLFLATLDLTHKDAPASSISLDIATWLYGSATLAYGGAFQLRAMNGDIASRLPVADWHVYLGLGAGALALAIALVLIGRHRLRALFTATSLVALLACGFLFALAVLQADAAGLRLL